MLVRCPARSVRAGFPHAFAAGTALGLVYGMKHFQDRQRRAEHSCSKISPRKIRFLFHLVEGKMQ